MVLLAVCSLLFVLAESTMLMFTDLNEDLRPGFDDRLKPAELSITNRLGYMLLTHIFMVVHNRKRRRNLRNHAKLLLEHEKNAENISIEVDRCQWLLQNIFPPEVLERLHDKQGGGGVSELAKGKRGDK